MTFYVCEFNFCKILQKVSLEIFSFFFILAWECAVLLSVCSWVLWIHHWHWHEALWELSLVSCWQSTWWHESWHCHKLWLLGHHWCWGGRHTWSGGTSLLSHHLLLHSHLLGQHSLVLLEHLLVHSHLLVDHLLLIHEHLVLS